MSQFAHLAKYEPAGRFSWLTLPFGIAQEDGTTRYARLKLQYAGDSNKGWRQALTRYNAQHGAEARKALATDPGAFERLMQARDRKLFPLHVVSDWENVPDTENEAVPFTVDACKELISKLPSWIFNDVRLHAVTATNFLDDDGVSPVDAADFAGN